MSFSVTVLGCSGTYAAAGDSCSGYLLRSDTTSVWLDCGPGTLGNLQRHVPLLELDGIVTSHSHPDHWVELPVVYNAVRYVLRRPDAAIPVLWTAATANLFGFVSGQPAEPTFAPRVVAHGDHHRIGDIEFTFSRTDHPVETLAVRADCDGASLVYSADTGDGWSLASLGAGADVALVEATLDEDAAGTVQHLTARQAAAQASAAGVARLLLTHLAPGSDPEARIAEASAVFDGPVDVVRTGERYPV